jgi:putative methyltransferase (TIGR04325 family)
VIGEQEVKVSSATGRSTPRWLLPGPIRRFREHLREIRRMLGETQQMVFEVRAALVQIDSQLQELSGEGTQATLRPGAGGMVAEQPVGNDGIEEQSAPEWEFIPEGWAHASEARGWDAVEVARSYREKWPRFLEAVEGPGPLGVDHEVPLGVSIERHGLIAQSAVLAWAYALARATDGARDLSVLDWGGALGHYYVHARKLLPDVEFDYHCRELPAVCAEGRRVLSEVTFHEGDDCLGQRYDLVVASGSLQFDEDWRARLRTLTQAARKWLFLTRLPLVNNHPTFVVLQRAHAYGYATEYIGWVLNRHELLDAASDCGLELEREFALQPPFVPEGAPEPVAHGAFLFRRSTEST